MMGRTLIHARRARRTRYGNAILQMAFTLAILLNLTFGVVEFGYYFYVKNAFAIASRLGCRQAVLPGSTNTNVTSEVSTALAPFKFPASSYTVSITDTSGNALTLSNVKLGTNVEVELSATWSVIGAGFRPLTLIGGSKVVKNFCVMTHE